MGWHPLRLHQASLDGGESRVNCKLRKKSWDSGDLPNVEAAIGRCSRRYKCTSLWASLERVSHLA